MTRVTRCSGEEGRGQTGVGRRLLGKGSAQGKESDNERREETDKERNPEKKTPETTIQFPPPNLPTEVPRFTALRRNNSRNHALETHFIEERSSILNSKGGALGLSRRTIAPTHGLRRCNRVLISGSQRAAHAKGETKQGHPMTYKRQ